jgi:surface polysaccharide O-acyltransferase-like enzyme
MDRQQSRVIDLLRFPLAVLVVMCHCGFLDGGGTAVQIFFSETLPHVAVPLFLLFSGYLFFKEGQFDGALYWRKLKSRFRTLFIPYIVWSTICFIIAVVQGQVTPSFLHYFRGLWDTELWNDGVTFSRSLPGYPVNMPLWFIRDLMILVLISPLIWFLLKKTRGWGILLFTIWWFPAHDKFFGFGADSLFFFSLGALFAMKQVNFVQLARKYAIPLYIAAGVMLVVDYLVMYRNYMQYHELRFNWLVFNVYVLCITSATLALAGKLAGKKCSDVLIRLSGASFFLYAAHILWLEPLRDALLKVLSPASEFAVILFYFAFIAFHCTVVTALFFLMCKYLPKTTALITGGRVSSAS